MSKVFTFNHTRQGTYLDSISKTTGTPTNGRFEPTGKGVAWYSNDDAKIDLNQTFVISKDSATIEIWFTTEILANFRFMLGYNSSGKSYLGLNLNSLTIESDTNADFWLNYAYSNLTKKAWHHLMIVADSGTVRSYLNNVLISTTTPVDDLTLDHIGGYSGAGPEWYGYIAKVIFDDEPYTAKQRIKAMKEFTDASAILETNYPEYDLLMQKALDLSKKGDLITSYNMLADNETLVDISGNGHNGTLHGFPKQGAKGLYFNGGDDYISIPDSNQYQFADGQAWTFTGRFKPNKLNSLQILHNTATSAGAGATGVAIAIDSAQNRLRLEVFGNVGGRQVWRTSVNSIKLDTEHDFVIAFNGTTLVNAYIDGVLDTPQAITDPAGIPQTSICYIGALNNTGSWQYKGWLYDIEVHSKFFTETEAQAYHNKWAKPYLVETFMDEGVGCQMPTHWLVGDATLNDYIIGEQTTQDPVLKHIKPGMKYYKCDNSNDVFVAMPSKQAFGTWEMDIYMSTSGQAFVQLLSTSPTFSNPHSILINLSALMQLGGYSGGTKFMSPVDFLSKDSWYRFKITRTKSGVWTWYIKGTEHGNQYILIPADSGTNPYTDTTNTVSEYFTIRFETGMRIANLKFSPEIVQ